MLLIGKTQSGKSTLATYLAAGYRRGLVFDSKHDAGAVPPLWPVRYGVDAALQQLPGRVVYRPLPREQGDVRRHFDRLVRRILNTGGAHVIVIHELRDVSPVTGSAPYLSAAYRQGASQRIPMILCAQRPFGIDVSTVSEAEHFALFELQYPTDLTLVSRLFALDPVALSIAKPPYWFHHRGPDGVVRLARPITPKTAAEPPAHDVLGSNEGPPDRHPDRRRPRRIWQPRRRPRPE